jgi:hypothetical protein
MSSIQEPLSDAPSHFTKSDETELRHTILL